MVTEPRWTPVVSMCSGVASLKVFASIFPPVFYPAALFIHAAVQWREQQEALVSSQ